MSSIEVVIAVIFMLCRMVGPGDGEVGFSARYYFEGERRSYFHLYLSDIDGKNRRQLTFGNRDSELLTWVDRDNIAFLETPGFWRRLYSVPSDGEVLVKILNLRDGLTRTIGTYPYGKIDWDYKCKSIQMDHKFYKIELQGIKEVAEPASDTYDIIEGDNPGYIFKRADGSTVLVRYSDEVHSEEAHSTGTFYTIRHNHNEWKSISQSVNFVEFVDGPSNEVFLKMYDFTQSREPIVTLIAWDLNNGNRWKTIRDVNDVQFNPNNYEWAGVLRRSAYRSLKDRRFVLTNKLYAGNWRSGENWVVASGLTLVSGYELRPRER